MLNKEPIGKISALSSRSLGVFRGRDAVEVGVSRKQLAALRAAGIIERDLPDVYRMVVVQRSSEQRLRAALMWAGDDSAAAVLSAGELYVLQGVSAAIPEIVVPSLNFKRSGEVIVHQSSENSLMVRRYRGLRVTGVEATLVALAHVLEAEAFEIACEDARRRSLTSVPALQAFLQRFGRKGQKGISATRRLLGELDPVHAARSTLEVKTRRLLVEHGITGFEREVPLDWNGRTYLFDFVFDASRTVLETNGRRWHDDASDYEHDNEKWSVPGRHGYKIVFATWDKVTATPELLVNELRATLASEPTTRTSAH